LEFSNGYSVKFASCFLFILPQITQIYADVGV
jgi:hypothetical protein